MNITLKLSPWGEPNASLLGSDGSCHCFSNFERKTSTVFDRAAVLVCALVACILEELI
jgi:hypothetical protein